MKVWIVALITLISTSYSIAQIEISNFSPDHIPTGFHAITAENDVFIVTFPEADRQWKSHCFSEDGKVLWETALPMEKNEYVIQDELFHGILNVFSTVKNEEEKTAELHLTRLDEKTGEIQSKNVLWTSKVKDVHFNENKADVIADENMALVALRSDEVEVHVEYRFNLSISPDESTLLFYIYDYSLPELKMHYRTFDQKLNMLDSGEIDFEDGTFLFDLKVNNKGDIYTASALLEGQVDIDKYEKGYNEPLSIRLQEQDYIRDDITLLLRDDDRVFLACKAEVDEFFHGVYFAYLDFVKISIEREVFQPLTKSMIKHVDSLHKAGAIPKVVWTKYNLTHFDFLDDDPFLVYEHMDIKHAGHIFREIDFVSRLPWKEHKSKIQTGPALLFSFNEGLGMKWFKYFDVHLASEEDVFPLSSAVYVQSPADDYLLLAVSEDEKSYVYEIEYMKDANEKLDDLDIEGRIIPFWTVRMNDKFYASFYSEEKKSLLIHEIK